MKIMRNVLKYSLIGTGIGVTFIGGFYSGAVMVGYTMNKVLPSTAAEMKWRADRIRNLNTIDESTKNRADLIYEVLK